MARCKLHQEAYANILISVTEAVNNAIEHGNKRDVKKYVDIKSQQNGRSVVIRVTDEGNGFNHNNVQDPTLPENIECCGGRGVFIMKQLSDQLHFKNNGRTVELHFKIHE